ncbi:tetratricopeptide repeat protein [Leptothoe kymatousa]|uniref:Tetratricopeptide repeat protein n=1 Tax=Leptothoe kymatousa TAU-MAC 1615 TaxID=2364775 RepID=A0ABS5Y7D2_9CYAN|nr:tetratricopeptide repeat protein [Leptothoe kymatousa]MBT9313408.1 tetratricopeptide repeat protein [Leptothoe kymatousa TAU-MAC 1615]
MAKPIITRPLPSNFQSKPAPPNVPMYPYSGDLWDKFEQFRNDPQLQRLVEEDLQKSLVIRQVIQDEVDRTFNHTTTLLNVLLVVLTAIPILTAAGFWFIRRSVINQVLVEVQNQLQQEVQLQFDKTIASELRTKSTRFEQEIQTLRDEFSTQLQQLNSDAQSEKDTLMAELEKLLPASIPDDISPDLQPKLHALTQQLRNLKANHGRINFTETDYLDQGKALYLEGLYPDAVEAFAQTLALNPSSTKALLYQGMSLTKLQQYRAAITQYDRALMIDRSLPEVWCAKGMAEVKCQKLEAAITSYDQATCLKPDFYQAWFGKARSYALNDDTELALEALETAIQLNPQRCLEGAKTEQAFEKLRQTSTFQKLIQHSP